ncbi:MAG TPA: hypothetical protein VF062_27060 [Candidatus Limnocylindrales bacterium]
MDLTTAYTDAWLNQPDPVGWPEDRRPGNQEWVLIAAVWLLAMWVPSGGWAAVPVPGKTKARSDEQWPEPPAPAELAQLADLPGVTGARILTSRVSPGPGRPFVPPRADEDTAAELVTLISEVVTAGDTRAQTLLRYLAGRLAGPYSDLLRLDAGDGLHLLHRDTWGKTLRLSLVPARTVQQPPAIPADGPDALLRTRIACLATLLSELLWVNNNNPVNFRFQIGRLDPGDAGVEGASRWWASNREDADEYDDVEEFHPLSAAELRTGLHHLARLHLLDLFTGDWSGIEEMPEVPPRHLILFLLDDLLDLIVARMGADARLGYTGFLPLTWPPPDEDLEAEVEHAVVVLTAGDEVAVLEVDLGC